jgi:hypothetical protein
MAINPQQTYVHLAIDGAATELPETELNRYGGGWLVSEFEFAADWPNWEMHPNGDECG